jgi:hypothetical protein
MTYDITLWVINDPLIIIMVALVSGIVLFKLAYKILELIPGM